jgi:hypothetical protein
MFQICQHLHAFLRHFRFLGVIGDTLNTTLGLESMSWFLLAIIAAIFAVHPQMHAVAAKHLLYMDESKKE